MRLKLSQDELRPHRMSPTVAKDSTAAQGFDDSSGAGIVVHRFLPALDIRTFCATPNSMFLEIARRSASRSLATALWEARSLTACCLRCRLDLGDQNYRIPSALRTIRQVQI